MSDRILAYIQEQVLTTLKNSPVTGMSLELQAVAISHAAEEAARTHTRRDHSRLGRLPAPGRQAKILPAGLKTQGEKREHGPPWAVAQIAVLISEVPCLYATEINSHYTERA